jgi:type I restriction enzyme S subunit
MNDERGEWTSNTLPAGWNWVPFESVFEDVTDSARKLPQKDYAESGTLPVVDQGEGFVGGYTDDEALVHPMKPPFIVFGDHTRCVKYVDFPFVQGADGIKALIPKEGIEARYSYYALLAITLPDKGYSRHMKFLRASSFPICSMADQRRIVASLDSLLGGSKSARDELAHIPKLTERYKRAVLGSAFQGDLTAAWRTLKGTASFKQSRLEYMISESIRNGISIRGSDKPPGVRSLRLSALRSGVVALDDVRFLPLDDPQAQRFLLRDGDVLVGRGNGTKAFVGLAAIVRGPLEATVFPDTAFRIRLKPEKVSPEWLALLWNAPQVRKQIEGAAKTTAGIWKVSQTDLAKVELLLPELEEQREIVRRVHDAFSHVDNLVAETSRATILINRLDQAIFTKAFRGELVAPVEPSASVATDAAE